MQLYPPPSEQLIHQKLEAASSTTKHPINHDMPKPNTPEPDSDEEMDLQPTHTEPEEEATAAEQSGGDEDDGKKKKKKSSKKKSSSSRKSKQPTTDDQEERKIVTAWVLEMFAQAVDAGSEMELEGEPYVGEFAKRITKFRAKVDKAAKEAKEPLRTFLNLCQTSISIARNRIRTDTIESRITGEIIERQDADQLVFELPTGELKKFSMEAGPAIFCLHIFNAYHLQDILFSHIDKLAQTSPFINPEDSETNYYRLCAGADGTFQVAMVELAITIMYCGEKMLQKLAEKMAF